MEIIKEIEKIKEVVIEKEVPVEVEVIREVVVEKEVPVYVETPTRRKDKGDDEIESPRPKQIEGPQI